MKESKVSKNIQKRLLVCGFAIILLAIVASTGYYYYHQYYIPSVIYKKAMALASEGKTGEAKGVLTRIKNIRDITKDIDKLDNLYTYQGVWVDNYDRNYIFIKGTTVQKVTGYKTSYVKVKSMEELTYEQLLEQYTVEGEYLKKKLYSNKEPRNVFTVYSLVPEMKYPPKIGMTKSELKESIWGEPLNVKKHTTEELAREEWIYWDESKVIIIEDGVVVSIKE